MDRGEPVVDDDEGAAPQVPVSTRKNGMEKEVRHDKASNDLPQHREELHRTLNVCGPPGTAFRGLGKNRRLAVDVLAAHASNGDQAPHNSTQNAAFSPNEIPALRGLGKNISQRHQTTELDSALVRSSDNQRRRMSAGRTLRGVEPEKNAMGSLMHYLEDAPDHQRSSNPNLTDTVGVGFSNLDVSLPLPLEAPQQRQRRQRCPGAYPQAGVAAQGGGDDGVSMDSISGFFSGALPNSVDVESGLVRANPVRDSQMFTLEDLEVAEPMDAFSTNENKDEENQDKRRKITQRLCLSVPCLFLLVVGLVIGLVNRKQSSSSPNEAMTPTTAPTRSPTAAPDPLWDLLPSYTRNAILRHTNSTSPQYKAHEWIKGDKKFTTYSDARLLQRFVMATIYYATGGANWKHKGGETVLVQTSGKPGGPGTAGAGAKPGRLDPGVYGVNVTKARWLDYDAHECEWFHTFTHGEALAEICPDNETIQFFNLIKNDLTGSFPPELALLTSLRVIFVPLNEIGGTVMTEFGSLSNLKQLVIPSNRFIGTLPSELGLLSNLWQLTVIDNQLHGTLPSEIWNLSSLTHFKFAKNYLTGTLPNNMGDLFPKLIDFKADGSQFSGTLPSSFSQCSHLTVLEIGKSQFAGTIPSQLGVLPNITGIGLNGNEFTGTLPSELALGQNLRRLDLTANSGLSGTVPPQMGNLKLLQFKIKGTSITGTIPNGLCNISTLEFDCSPTLCGCGRCNCTA